jgi:hypothetical protein
MFSDNGKCPACGKSKYVLPRKSREQILYEQEKENITEKIEYLKKRASRLIFGGIALITIVLSIIIILILNSTIVVFWYGGLIIGFSLIVKGIADLRSKSDLQFIKRKKYNK